MHVRPHRVGIHRLRISAIALGIAWATNAAAAGQTRPLVYSDVRITFAGSSFGLIGVQTSFSQNQDGGKITFNLTTVDTLDYSPVPQIDTAALSTTGNHWEVVSKLGKKTYTFIGTCASETYSVASENGSLVRELFLNCQDVESNDLP